MTTSSNLESRSFIAAADFRTKQFYAMKVNASGQCMLPTAVGDPMVGVLQNKPNIGEIATVAVFGRTKWVCANAINAGQGVQSDAAGKAIPVATGYTAGYSAETAISSAGQIIEVDLLHMGMAVVLTGTLGAEGASVDEVRNTRGETKEEQAAREAAEDAEADLPGEERARRLHEREQIRINPLLREGFEAEWKARDEQIAAAREVAQAEAAHEAERAAARREAALARMSPAEREAHEKAEREASERNVTKRGPRYG